jgi:hypothetical protein
MRLQRKTIASILALCCALLLLTACPVNTKPTSRERQLVTIADEAAKNTGRALQLTDQLYDSHAFDSQDQINNARVAQMLTLGLQKVNNTNRAFINALKSYVKKDASGKDVLVLPDSARAALNPLAANVRDAITQFIGDGTLGIKNPAARAKYQAEVNALTALLQAISSFGGM